MRSPEIALRPIGPKDAAFLAELYRSTRWDELAAVGWDDEQKRAFLRQQLACQTQDWERNYPLASRNLVLVDHQPGGRLYVDRRPEAREMRLVDIALLPVFRGRGIGSRLLHELALEADRRNWTMLLQVELHNPARRLYARLGFVPVRQNGSRLLMERCRQPADAPDRLKTPD